MTAQGESIAVKHQRIHLFNDKSSIALAERKLNE